ncbi:MAG: quinolinate synthase NadA [Ignavibacteriales bacterium]|nr:quinolinate synthase NadA [Ignavibacteriales bacterium]MCF8305367.1 quinolinate synthase NadA [Ignavibacteriales bacterium]MCF8316050.1 quinolinate synthase NadA [Ignavibacteriales bacterium]MCF8436552.1 quinolinate synthase NadA [Ignavibacteriales bacterium]
MSKNEIIDAINTLRKEKKAVILAHNYVIPEVQDIADFVGDSLGLSQQAALTESETIIFCGVHFMAETASIISPEKKVLIPDTDAGCSLAASITADQLRAWKADHPGAVVVSYVNTTAAVKAETDYCVTSTNAVRVVQSIPAGLKILFLPDKFLGSYVRQVTGRDIEIWDGACHVHEKIGEEEMQAAVVRHPGAEVLVHPECGCSTSCMLKSIHYGGNEKIEIFSTEGMVNYVRKSDNEEFLIATETGIIHRMQKFNPGKTFYPVSEKSVCEYMKMITLENLMDSLRNDQYEVKVEKSLAERARLPIERMLAIK